MRVQDKFFDVLRDSLFDERLLFIDMARRLAVLEEIVERVDETPEMLDNEDMLYLMQFENPLEILADCAEEQRSESMDLDDVLAEVLDDDTLPNRYEMLPEPEQQG